jgi:hypothetical protein
MRMDDIFKYRLFFAVGGFLLIWGISAALRRLRGKRIPLPSNDDLRSLFREIRNVPIDGYFSGRIDSTSSNLGIFKDHLNQYFIKISAISKQYRLLFVLDDLSYVDGAGNIVQGKANELFVKRAYYDGRGHQGTLAFRVELKLILTKQVYNAFHWNAYGAALSEFEASVDLEEVRLSILNSLEQAICKQFNFLYEGPSSSHSSEAARETIAATSNEVVQLSEILESAIEIDRNELERGKRIRRYGLVIGIVVVVGFALVSSLADGANDDTLAVQMLIMMVGVLAGLVTWVHGSRVQNFARRGEKHPGFGKGTMPIE